MQKNLGLHTDYICFVKLWESISLRQADFQNNISKPLVTKIAGENVNARLQTMFLKSFQGNLVIPWLRVITLFQGI